MVEFGREEVSRYARHLVLPEVGPDGQRRLKEGSVLLVGAGGLGSPLALYLAAAGVGRLGLVEFDRVDASNLQRQVLYNTSDVGRLKGEAARERILGINPHVEVDLHPVRLSAENALEILRPYQVVADGSDNFATRYLVNDACVLLGKPNVYGSVFRFEGQASVFQTPAGPCYRCLFPEPPPPGSVLSCSEGGVLGILPGVIGLIQATEVVKLLLGIGQTLVGRLLLYDALRMEFRELRVPRNLECPICGTNPTIHELIDYEGFCAGGRGQERESLELSALEVQRRLAGGEKLRLVDVREPLERAICSIDGSLFIPMAELPGRLGEIDPAQPTVVYCHVGVRSLQATEFLRSRGYETVWSMAGGIEAWARQVDPSMRRY